MMDAYEAFLAAKAPRATSVGIKPGRTHPHTKCLDPGMTKDLQGRPWLTFAQAKPGTWVRVDGDFTCIKNGSWRMIRCDKTRPKYAQLWIRCECIRHYLDGQASFDGGKFYVGLYPAVVRRGIA
jgi:hypothetical protein